MGILSSYVAYKIGKSRERNKWETFVESQKDIPVNRECIYFSSLCGPRGSCPRHSIHQCMYDEE